MVTNTPIRFGIIGAAGRGSSFARSLRANPATELTALCDLRAEPLLLGEAALVEQVGQFRASQALLDRRDEVINDLPIIDRLPRDAFLTQHGPERGGSIRGCQSGRVLP